MIEVVDELFASEPPGYVRMPERRIDLIRWFSEWKPATDDEVVAAAHPVRHRLRRERRGSPRSTAWPARDPAKIARPLIAALLRPEEESGRIKRTIVEVLEKSKAPLGDQADAVAAVLVGPLADDFKVEGGQVKKR